jgi:streptogramin lyase
MMKTRIGFAGIGVALLALFGATCPTIVSGQAFNEFPIPTAGSVINVIAVGSDGNLWFNEGTSDQRVAGVNKIGRITPAGVITEFPIPTANSGATGMIAGPDGNLWFSERS